MRNPTVSRRKLLASGAAAAGIGLAGCMGGNGGSDGPTVGILEDRSGNFQLNGTSKWQATRLAIEEINEDGGILGEEVEIVDPDPQSDNERYQELTERLILQDQVDALWAGYSSATREAIRPIINDEDQLYFYTTQYEGGVCDDTIFAVGSTARQQLGAVTPYLADQYGEDIYIIAADYNFGQLSGDWVNVIAEENGYNIVGEEYIPLDESDFSSVINRIQAEDPDFIMSMLVGANHENFYDQRDSNDLMIPIGTSTTMAQGHEHIRYEPNAVTDVYAGVSYMEELGDLREGENFVEDFYDRWPDANYLNQEAQNNYFSVYMWKEAVEEAGTFDQDAVIDVLEEGVEMNAPSGRIELDGATHHITHQMRVAHADENHDISFDAEQEIGPSFLREEVEGGDGCDLRAESKTTQYEPADVYGDILE
ncbi:ABC-type transport system periplasmic substrate-binding protein (probable substrate urea/short-chain amides) [Natronomonas pharaonis DSM 2160]|uniref:ABC-type transport system periplasmic substrate-binding protein (Probable substrate urea/short-chain amides) n=1 Tax=Natronomonas pharaonis (strain ATCC 35678 / DSM 2160 / CIP 103997 / JCM 8858 / NBRC 14720 / NCIMB 2260 / Gabara) TaxID=348780 RepID=A0A1U7EVN1_NATPD|nr:urea ABC transporter substrate-binding protein [Natronomonas pharaonis]CAI49093.1 ABC-type transport system periplasmic substrate-binding protein (probable substrate urea/short-chain amides) [Natronomonas pharaonis DSM 2160]